MNILICEDSPTILEQLQDALEAKGHICTLAENARKGSEIAALQDFDLVITDMEMDFGGGESIISELSSRVGKIIVYSGKVDGDLRRKIKSLSKILLYSKTRYLPAQIAMMADQLLKVTKKPFLA